MEFNNLALLKMLSLLYEDLDLDTIEERFVSLVGEIFAFDRVGLFFVKHKRGILQGKLCKGFDPGAISSLQIPISEGNIFTRPLVSGLPCRSQDAPATKCPKRNSNARVRTSHRNPMPNN